MLLPGLVHVVVSDDCHADMKEQFVYDPLISKRQQYLLATQVSSCILFCYKLLTYGDYSLSERYSKLVSFFTPCSFTVPNLTMTFVDDVIVSGEHDDE